MKKIERVKLNQLSKADLDARRMNALKGGSGCGCSICGCQWDECGCIANCVFDCNGDVSDQNMK